MLIDSHCHLEKSVKAGELEAVLQRASDAGVNRMIAVGTGPDDWEIYYRLAAKYPRRIDWTVGIHPCSVEEGWDDAVKTIPSYFATDPLPVALGEIGLDYFHLPKYPDEAAEVRKMQVEAFRAQLGIAYQLDCPVVIHSRNAFDDCVALIDASGVAWNKVVFHCFTEGPEQMRILMQRGGRASFTGVVTYKSAANVREAMALQGAKNLMLETDAPYLAPEPHRGSKCEPAMVLHTGQRCAEVLGIQPDVLFEQVKRNTVEFFRLEE